MKHLIKVLTICFLYICLTSFTWKNIQDNILKYNNTVKVVSPANRNSDEVIITFKNSDVCGLKYLGFITVTEKCWVHYNNKLKEQTQKELKEQASEKGGNIVFVDIKEISGFGIFFSTTIDGYVFQK